jgi:hypothetical protein
MAQQIVCDITKAVIRPGENVGTVPMLVSYGGVELVVMARSRADGSCPDLQARAIRVMVERGELRPASSLTAAAETAPAVLPPLQLLAASGRV